jgi:hypothetical protein
MSLRHIARVPPDPPKECYWPSPVKTWKMNVMISPGIVPSGTAFRDEARFDRELKMTVHAPKLLTPEEFASLIEIAITSPSPTVPAAHLAKLISLGFVIVTAKGPVVTGDGLIRITESE